MHITTASPLHTKQMQPNFGGNLDIVSFLTLLMSYLVERLLWSSGHNLELLAENICHTSLLQNLQDNFHHKKMQTVNKIFI